MTGGGNDPRPPRWLMAGVCATTFAASLSLVSTLGWTHGPIVTALLATSTLVTLGVALVSTHLPKATRRQVRASVLLVIAIFGLVVAASWLWGREDVADETTELGPPPQRELDQLDSVCQEPDADLLMGPRSSRIQSSLVALTKRGQGDFIAVLSSDITSSAMWNDTRLIVLECDGTSWEQTLTRTSDRDCGAEIEVTQLRNIDQEEILYKSVCGSGGFVIMSCLVSMRAPVR
jgi:hypothetical protein